jgi:hypothetical protein
VGAALSADVDAPTEPHHFLLYRNAVNLTCVWRPAYCRILCMASSILAPSRDARSYPAAVELPGKFIESCHIAESARRDIAPR